MGIPGNLGFLPGHPLTPGEGVAQLPESWQPFWHPKEFPV